MSYNKSQFIECLVVGWYIILTAIVMSFPLGLIAVGIYELTVYGCISCAVWMILLAIVYVAGFVWIIANDHEKENL